MANEPSLLSSLMAADGNTKPAPPPKITHEPDIHYRQVRGSIVMA